MKYDVIIVGAGIIGLATGLKILEKNPGLNILFLEKENSIAKHQTGNNSGVIHSGIYYKPGSLKAQNCIHGYRLLIEFCRDHKIPFSVCGKIILATNEEELSGLRNIYERGLQNGLSGIKILNKKELKEKEPHANGISAIWVPQTGIVDYKKVSEKYLDFSLSFGAQINFNQNVLNIAITSDEISVVTQDRPYSAKMVVTCAGLFSDRITSLTHKQLDYRLIPFRGEYYKLNKDSHHLVNGLIYPVPDPTFPFLGVHFTRMMNDEVECGPNAVLAFMREGYSKTSFNFSDILDIFSWRGFQKVMKQYWKTGLGEFYCSYNKVAFVKTLQKLVPEIRDVHLHTEGVGIRAQACMKNGNLLDDFYILEDKRVVHVCNAPSPAATASLSIGEYIATRVLNQLV